MNDLPNGWLKVPLADVARAEYGKGLREKDRVQTGPHPVYGSAGIVGCHDTAFVEGPVIIIGRKGNAGTVWLEKAPCWPIDTTYFIRVPSVLSAAFLAYQLQWRELKGLDSSTAVPSLRRSDLEACAIRLPPRVDQERIVAAIEEHFSRLDAAEASLQSALQRVRLLSDAARASLLDREWPSRRLGDIATIGSGATPKKSEPRYWRGGHVPWVTSGQLNADYITEPAALITKDALDETSVRLWPAGTILVAMYGEGRTRGRAAELTFESTCNQACAAIHVDESILDRRFLRHYLDTRYEENRKLASGGVQPNLSLGLIKGLIIPCPDLEEQARVVGAIQLHHERADRLSEDVTAARKNCAALGQAILAAAFSGRLVPQDPSDEPASVLLERVCAEREAATKPVRRRPRTRA